jgi:hypothetical protein
MEPAVDASAVRGSMLINTEDNRPNMSPISTFTTTVYNIIQYFEVVKHFRQKGADNLRVI